MNYKPNSNYRYTQYKNKKFHNNYRNNWNEKIDYYFENSFNQNKEIVKPTTSNSNLIQGVTISNLAPNTNTKSNTNTYTNTNTNNIQNNNITDNGSSYVSFMKLPRMMQKMEGSSNDQIEKENKIESSKLDIFGCDELKWKKLDQSKKIDVLDFRIKTQLKLKEPTIIIQIIGYLIGKDADNYNEDNLTNVCIF